MIVADFSLVHALKSCFEQFHFGIVKLLSFFSAFFWKHPGGKPRDGLFPDRSFVHKCIVSGDGY
jgi:hypothetical protein